MIGSPRLAVRDYVIDTMLCFFLFTKCVCVCVCVCISVTSLFSVDTLVSRIWFDAVCS